ncbi:MAG: threonine ammonia-lyase IlvA [Flavobacteriaceae bacterium]|nr:threonine ammonia-lyase IlvA [Flavobacteriaceae bacterium]
MRQPNVEGALAAQARLKEVALVTPFQHLARFSDKFNAQVYTKREDLQQVRSFKIRGAYNKFLTLNEQERSKGTVCASAGNHAQGFAYACRALKVKGTIFMPVPTPNQKVDQVRMFGGAFVDIQLIGDTYDDSSKAAQYYQKENDLVFIHPFDDVDVIEGQATIALEIIAQADQPLDYLFVPVGGGGLISGILTVFKSLSPSTKIIGVEPAGAPSLRVSLDNKKNTRLKTIDKFVDGAAVQRVGDLCFAVCEDHLDDCISVDEGRICQEILTLYNTEGIVAEPAGAISLAALDQYADQLDGKQVGTLICGGNNDITRTPEIKERALLYAQLKHYFIVRFPQRAGALKEFVNDILGPQDDITFFEYSKKNSRVNAPAVVGIQLKEASDFDPLVSRMKAHGFFGDYLNEKPDLFQYLV